MSVRVVFLCALAVAIPLEAQRVDVQAQVGISVTRVIVSGGAQFYTSVGTTPSQGISGFLTLYEDNVDVHDMPWQGYGSWQGSFTYAGDYGLCYVAAINGHAVNTPVTTNYSDTACIASPPSQPPYYHGYDICPLILDLDGDGIPTTGLEDTVAFFDTNHDGIREASGWTARYARDAFLWMDMNGNGRPDPGELFGAGMPMPEGGYARNGFQALALYDDAEYGGNGDGQITRDDAIWDRLRLWIDSNHDGLAEPHEISTPGSAHILAIDLNDTPLHRIMSNGNVLMYLSWMTFRGGRRVRVADISFIPAAS